MSRRRQGTASEMQESGRVRELQAAQVALTERLAELELALEDLSWVRLTMQADLEFSREGLRQINRIARIMFLKNPLIQRGVTVQAHYVFGQGVNVHGRSEAVNEVVQAFLDDPRNQAELTGHQARIDKEKELQVLGGLFFVFFADRATGRVTVRTIPYDEVDDIVCNPEDAKEPWYYKRTWSQQKLNMDRGMLESQQKTVYYPDFRYHPDNRPPSIGGEEVRWDEPVYHVRVGGLADMKFGLSEVYAAIDWAKAYKEFLEDWATITRAYSRYAWQLTTKGGSKGVAAAKLKLNSTYGNAGTAAETNPAPVTGSTFLGAEGTSLNPIRTAGATTSAEDGRRILLMVAAAQGLPESFYGDVSVGTLATAKSLDRPTELKMLSRQTLWADVFRTILNYAVLWAIKAPNGKLHQAGQVMQVDDREIVVLDTDPDTGKPMDATVDVEFPPILEHDISALVTAIVTAATLNGGTPAGTIDPKTLSRLLLTTLGVADVDEILATLFPEGSKEEMPEGAEQSAAEALMVEAVDELREAILAFGERYGLGSAADPAGREWESGRVGEGETATSPSPTGDAHSPDPSANEAGE